jgi:alpha-tubulin suppressor-like RCC1 family protein
VVNKAAPVSVNGLASGITTIATGVFHTCAVTTAGVPMCWGDNQFGQLGDGTSGNNRYMPMAVSGLTGVAAMAAGAGHTCALTTAGTVYCWGSNSRGELGDGTTVDKITPVPVSGLTGVAAIAADWYYTCALTTTGGAYCWGDNYKGQLGDGTTNDKTTPVAVIGLGSGVAAIATGVDHACALTLAGAAKCWGYNHFGQLGDGTNTDSTTPVTVSGLSSGVAAITAGDGHTCAVTTSGAIKCWGYNGEGELGIGTTSFGSTIPVAVSGLTSGVTAIAAGDNHTCAVTTAGAAYCWGQNNSYQSGGSLPVITLPAEVYALYNVVAISARGLHTCALTTAGRVVCWGYNGYGQVGAPPSDRVFPQSLRAGLSIALEPLARVGLGSTANAAGLFASAYTSVDTWTPDTCSASGNLLTFIHTGLCGVRVSQGDDSYGYGEVAAAPRQLRLIQVEADLIFANGADVWNGMKH